MYVLYVEWDVDIHGREYVRRIDSMETKINMKVVK